MDHDALIEKIIEKTKLTREDVQRKILDKQQELSNLVSKEGAAYIVAKELGLELFPKVKRRLEIKNVLPKIRNLKLSGRVLNVFPPKEFITKGRTGRVANVILGDDSGTIRLSLWDDQTHITEKIKPGMTVEAFGAYTKEDGFGKVELRLGKRGGLRILRESDLPSVEELQGLARVKRNKIMNLSEGEVCELRASLVQLFETNFFYEVCPNCGGRVKGEDGVFKCSKHGEVEPTYSIVLSGVIDDGSGNVRAVFFRNAALQLIGMSLEDALKNKDGLLDNIDVLGNEFILTGMVKRNKMFNRLEFVVRNVRDVDIVNEANKIINNLTSNV